MVRRRDLDGEIVAVDQADVVEICVASAVEGELGDAGRRHSACAVALQPSAAVAGGAPQATRRILVAAAPAPEAAGPSVRDRRGAAGARVEPPAAAVRDGVAGIA